MTAIRTVLPQGSAPEPCLRASVTGRVTADLYSTSPYRQGALGYDYDPQYLSVTPYRSYRRDSYPDCPAPAQLCHCHLSDRNRADRSRSATLHRWPVNVSGPSTKSQVGCVL